MHLILFFLFAGFCLAGAINLLVQSHPINSALSLIVVMSSLAVLYLLLGAEFLAAAQVIVYAGAIMVLFVFTVMLLNAGREERTMGSRVGRAIGFPAVVVVLGVIATVVLSACATASPPPRTSAVSSSTNSCCLLKSPRSSSSSPSSAPSPWPVTDTETRSKTRPPRRKPTAEMQQGWPPSELFPFAGCPAPVLSAA
jgi:NADH:ubiquinone oxidoreductase subunit 6 (subunit J)